MCNTSQSHFNDLVAICLEATILNSAGLENKKWSAYREKDFKKQTNLAFRTYKVLGTLPSKVLNWKYWFPLKAKIWSGTEWRKIDCKSVKKQLISSKSESSIIAARGMPLLASLGHHHYWCHQKYWKLLSISYCPGIFHIITIDSLNFMK